MSKEDKYELIALFLWTIMNGLACYAIAKAFNHNIWVVLATGLFQFWAAYKIGTAVGKQSAKRYREGASK